MSGSIPPIRMGLTNVDEIMSLVKITAKLNKYISFIAKYEPFSSQTFISSFYLIFCTQFEIICYGIPYFIYFIFFCYHVFNFIAFQFMFFYLMCLYLKIKINALNESTNRNGEKKTIHKNQRNSSII